MRDSVERPASTRPATRCGPGARSSSWSGGCTIWAGPSGASGLCGCSSRSSWPVPPAGRCGPIPAARGGAPAADLLTGGGARMTRACRPGRAGRRALPGPAPASRVRAADQAGPRHPGRPHRGGAPPGGHDQPGTVGSGSEPAGRR